VRWQVTQQLAVNWDWTDGDSLPDSHYLRSNRIRQHWSDAGLFIVGQSPDAMRGYYLCQLGTKFSNTSLGVALLERASKLAPLEPSNLNNLAWAYATSASTDPGTRRLGVSYAF